MGENVKMAEKRTFNDMRLISLMKSKLVNCIDQKRQCSERCKCTRLSLSVLANQWTAGSVDEEKQPHRREKGKVCRSTSLDCSSTIPTTTSARCLSEFMPIKRKQDSFNNNLFTSAHCVGRRACAVHHWRQDKRRKTKNLRYAAERIRAYTRDKADTESVGH